MSKYIEQLTESDIKQFVKFAGYEFVKTHLHRNCVTINLRNKYIELEYVAKDYTLRAKHCFGTAELYEADIQTAWRLFMKKKFKKDYKYDFLAWLDEQKFLINHSTKSL